MLSHFQVHISSQLIIIIIIHFILHILEIIPPWFYLLISHWCICDKKILIIELNCSRVLRIVASFHFARINFKHQRSSSHTIPEWSVCTPYGLLSKKTKRNKTKQKQNKTKEKEEVQWSLEISVVLVRFGVGGSKVKLSYSQKVFKSNLPRWS